MTTQNCVVYFAVASGSREKRTQLNVGPNMHIYIYTFINIYIYIHLNIYKYTNNYMPNEKICI